MPGRSGTWARLLLRSRIGIDEVGPEPIQADKRSNAPPRSASFSECVPMTAVGVKSGPKVDVCVESGLPRSAGTTGMSRLCQDRPTTVRFPTGRPAGRNIKVVST